LLAVRSNPIGAMASTRRFPRGAARAALSARRYPRETIRATLRTRRPPRNAIGLTTSRARRTACVAPRFFCLT
jgi:hypothetical protein